jgi:TATA-box binding protein (TBP) (component of TFIID and TFIIIB)
MTEASVAAAVRAALQAIDEDIEQRALQAPGLAGGSGEVPMYTTNVVSLCDLGLVRRRGRVPIKDICRHLQGKYSGGIFPACVSHCDETKCAHTLFSTTSCVTAGAKSTHTSLSSAMLLAHTLTDFFGDQWLQVTDFQVTNVVTACRLPYWIDMERLMCDFQYVNGVERTDVFPGYTIKRYLLHDGDGEWTSQKPLAPRVIDKKKGDKAVSFIVFARGNVNTTGISSEKDIPEVYEELQRTLTPYYMTPPAAPLLTEKKGKKGKKRKLTTEESQPSSLSSALGSQPPSRRQ